ncbi:MAG: hypothetical protein HS115_15190 [Spirochaetales bacterium]|nr:hypothetical protein [Spirochaetales bacterium]
MLPVLRAYLLLLFTASLAARTDQARHWLDQADWEYRSGSFERAEFHLRQALAADPRWMEKDARALRLRGLVDLAAGKTLSGYNYLQLSLEIQDDARLYYMVADHHLSLRNHRSAAEAYARAVRSQKSAPLHGSYTHLAFLPLACPVVQGEAWLAARRKNDFADFSRLPLLAESSLTREELVVSAYLAEALGRLYSIENNRSSEEALQTLLSGTSAKDFLFPDTLEYIRNRHKTDAHDRCFNRIQALYREQEARISAGTTEATLGYLPFLKEKTKLLFWLRAAHAPDPSSYYSFSSFLLQEGESLEALHLARRALKLQLNWPELPPERLSDLLATMRMLEHIYRERGEPSASRSAGLFCAELEKLRKGEATLGPPVQRKLREIARENYEWREGLVFLIATSAEPEKGRYRKMLDRRDEKHSEKELFSAYQFLY